MNKMDIFSKYIPRINISVSRSSPYGVLGKTELIENGKTYVVKIGTFSRPYFSNLSPIIEVICSEIISMLGIPCAKYELREVIIKEGPKWKEQRVLCCYSEVFTYDKTVLVHASKLLNNSKERVSYKTSLNYFRELDINNMIIIDYIINNVDRHYRNFGLLVGNGSSIFAPLYDHGFSLGQDIDDDYLESESDDFSEVYTYSDYCNCFEVTNLAQLKYVKFTSVNLDVPLDNLLSIIDKYSNYIPDYRLEFMKYIITRRYQHVRNLFYKESELYIRKDN